MYKIKAPSPTQAAKPQVGFDQAWHLLTSPVVRLPASSRGSGPSSARALGKAVTRQFRGAQDRRGAATTKALREHPLGQKVKACTPRAGFSISWRADIGCKPPPQSWCISDAAAIKDGCRQRPPQIAHMCLSVREILRDAVKSISFSEIDSRACRARERAGRSERRDCISADVYVWRGFWSKSQANGEATKCARVDIVMPHDSKHVVVS